MPRPRTSSDLRLPLAVTPFPGLASPPPPRAAWGAAARPGAPCAPRGRGRLAGTHVGPVRQAGSPQRVPRGPSPLHAELPKLPALGRETSKPASHPREEGNFALTVAQQRLAPPLWLGAHCAGAGRGPRFKCSWDRRLSGFASAAPGVMGTLAREAGARSGNSGRTGGRCLAFGGGGRGAAGGTDRCRVAPESQGCTSQVYTTRSNRFFVFRGRGDWLGSHEQYSVSFFLAHFTWG